MFTQLNGKDYDFWGNPLPGEHDRLLVIAPPQDAEAVLGKLGHSQLLDAYRHDHTARVESGNGFDFVIVNSPLLHAAKPGGSAVGAYAQKNWLVFITQTPEKLYSVIGPYLEEGNFVALDRFFDSVIISDFDRLEQIENEISALETAIIQHEDIDTANTILKLRKRILRYKNYYERLYDALDVFVDNENNFYTKTDVKNFCITRDRVDRLRLKSVNLQEQIVQTREAYQSQLDIGLNKTMKVLTVVTSLFLPLTLLVGWYGMNLRMPEYEWRYGYAFIILLSVALIVVLLIIFKKKKWF